MISRTSSTLSPIITVNNYVCFNYMFGFFDQPPPGMFYDHISDPGFKVVGYDYRGLDVTVAGKVYFTYLTLITFERSAMVIDLYGLFLVAGTIHANAFLLAFGCAVDLLYHT